MSKIMFRNTIYIYVISIITIVSCKTADSLIQENSNYSIKRETSKMGNYITIKLYDLEKKEEGLPNGIIKINDSLFETGKGSNMLTKTVAAGNLKLEASYIHKIKVSIANLIINKNDSLIVCVYMKDANIILE